MRTCADCGVSISDRNIAAYLCLDCREQRKRVRNRLEQRERRKRRSKGYAPLHGSGRVPCTALDCERTFLRTPFNLSRKFCWKCSEFFRKAGRRAARDRWWDRNRERENAKARIRAKARYWRNKEKAA